MGLELVSKNGERFKRSEELSVVRYKPLGNQMMVRLQEDATKTKGGIILEAIQKTFRHGKVLSVGPGRISNGERVPLQVKVGDTVLFSDGAGLALDIDNPDIRLLGEENVYAVKL